MSKARIKSRGRGTAPSRHNSTVWTIHVPSVVAEHLEVRRVLSDAFALSEITQTGQSTASGVITAIDSNASLNDAGRVAFVASTSAGSALWSSPGSGIPAVISFAPSTSRTYSYPQINNNNNVVVNERVTGPSYVVRTWSAVGGSSNIVVDTTTQQPANDRFSSVLVPSLANDGGVEFLGLTPTGSQFNVYSNPTAVRGSDNLLLSSLSGGGFKPMAANGGRVIIRNGGTATSPIELPQVGAQPVIIAGASLGFTAEGASPGISNDGSIVAFYGVDANGPGIFVSSGGTVQRIAGTTGSAPFASFSADTRVGITGLPTAGHSAEIVFEATGADQKLGVYSETLDVDPSHPGSFNVSSISVVAEQGDSIPGLAGTVQSFNLYDPVNDSGQVVFWAGDSSGDQAIDVASPATDKLVFVAQPVSGPAGVPINPSGGVTVQVEDADGDLLTNDNSYITINVQSGPTDDLQGSATKQAISGVATFSDLSLGVAGSFTFQAIDGTDTPATSDSFAIGPIELQGAFTNGVSTGEASIGLTPVGGAAFVPLLTENDGQVAYNQNSIVASGTFEAAQSDLDDPLFIGTFTVPQGQVSTSAMNVSPGVTIAGLTTSFSSLTFTTGVGGTTDDSYLTLTGGFTLPPSMGNLQITLPASVPFTVGANGLGISPGAVQVPDVNFAFDNGLDVSATDMSFVYIYSNLELKITGDFTASLKQAAGLVTLDLNLSGSNYIDYEQGRTPALEVVGSLTYSNPTATPFFDNLFSIVGAQIHFDNATLGNTTVTGSLSIKVPGGVFTGTVGFVNDYLDSLSLTGAELHIPLAPEGLFLETVGGGLAGLAPDNPNDTQITGTLGFSYGGIVTTSFTGSIQLDSDNTIDDIDGTVSVNVANGTATGTAYFEDDLVDGTFGLMSLSMQAFNNTISVQGNLIGSSDGLLTGSLSGTITLPELVGGGVVSATVNAYLSPSTDASLSYLSGSSNLEDFGTVTVRYGFDGSLAFSVTRLNITGVIGHWTSQLDLAKDSLDVIGGVLTTIVDQVKQGYNSGAWSGMGIASDAAAHDFQHLTAVAVVQNNQAGGLLFNASNPYNGLIPGTSDVLVKYTYYGDANLDGKVDGSDYSRIDSGYLTHANGWYNGDFNYDGVINGSDYTLIDNAFNRQTKLGGSSLSISAGTNYTLPFNGSGHSVLSENTVTIAGSTNAWTGTLDLTNGVLDIATGSLSTVSNQIKSGYNVGTWLGTGITSSTAASDTLHLTALGMLMNNQGGSPIFSAANPLDGVVPGPSDILVKYTYYGDANLDGKVDASDYSRIDSGFLTAATGWYNGDFNYDGIVNGSDYTLIDNAFNRQGASLAAELRHVSYSSTLVSAAARPISGFAADDSILSANSGSPVFRIASSIFADGDNDLSKKKLKLADSSLLR